MINKDVTPAKAGVHHDGFRLTPAGMTIFVLFARVIVGGSLIYAGFLKAVAPSAEFAAILAAYKLFPAALIGPLSIGLPYVEMWVGLFIFFGLYTRQAAVASVALSGAFFLSVVSTFLRHIDLASCGCFGPQSLQPNQTMVLDLILFGLSSAIFRQAKLPPPVSLDKTLP
jgi:uncharacterized membrane protein YphA (DoxX/SURF4 family)